MITITITLSCGCIQVGETPVGYGFVDLSSGEFSYTISNLNPGIAYNVHVSAINRHGQGVRANLKSGSVIPPLKIPSAPTNVTVNTKGYNVIEGDGMGDPQVKLRILIT